MHNVHVYDNNIQLLHMKDAVISDRSETFESKCIVFDDKEQSILNTAFTMSLSPELEHHTLSECWVLKGPATRDNFPMACRHICGACLKNSIKELYYN